MCIKDFVWRYTEWRHQHGCHINNLSLRQEDNENNRSDIGIEEAIGPFITGKILVIMKEVME